MIGKFLMKGNEVIGEAAIQAGCQCFYGYPITPQTEVLAYLSKEMPKKNLVFLQAESEISAINMIYGAAGTGVRCMTSSSSPGISLMAEGISYLAAARLPCVIIDVVRGGPGLGGIQPSQSDYLQVTKGLAHGDFNIPVYAPNSVQEIYDLIVNAFDVADIYRTPVMVMADGMLGQMMETVRITERKNKVLPEKEWKANGKGSRKTHNIITSLFLESSELEKLNLKLQSIYDEIQSKEVKVELINCDTPCDLILVSYGTSSRICKTVIKEAENEGINLGLIRPITLWPFPSKEIVSTLDNCKYGYLSVEMSCGQMIYDVKLSVNGEKDVFFYGRTGGVVPTPEEILVYIRNILGGKK